jgi:hypothetical protein
MRKPLPCEPSFGWKDELPSFESFVSEEFQPLLWMLWDEAVASFPATNEVTLKKEVDISTDRT